MLISLGVPYFTRLRHFEGSWAVPANERLSRTKRYGEGVNADARPKSTKMMKSYFTYFFYTLPIHTKGSPYKASRQYQLILSFFPFQIKVAPSFLVSL